jgi:hypothetical protein
MQKHIFWYVPAIFCNFEADFCGYELTGEAGFAFVREHGASFDNPAHGPLADSSGSREAYFAYITARTSQRQGEIATIEMPMIHGANHEVECLHFWFAIVVRSFRFCRTILVSS